MVGLVISFDNDVDPPPRRVGGHFARHGVGPYVTELLLEVVLPELGRLVLDSSCGIIVEATKDPGIDGAHDGDSRKTSSPGSL